LQTIFQTSLTPEQYVEQEHHKQVPPPENCPNCTGAQTLEALAYYRRYVSWLTKVLIICVRRFLCLHCRVSVSCLPDFAQPYRAINTATIAAAFSGQTQSREVQHWGTAIKPYWCRFEAHLPKLLQRVGNALGPVPLKATAQGVWAQLLGHCGDLATATRQLVHQFHTCLFANYRCHQRCRLHTE
jgi:hypothetical protein